MSPKEIKQASPKKTTKKDTARPIKKMKVGTSRPEGGQPGDEGGEVQSASISREVKVEKG